MAAAWMAVRRGAALSCRLTNLPFRAPAASAPPLFRNSFNTDSTQEVSRGYTGTDDDSGGTGISRRSSGGGDTDRSLSHPQDHHPTFLSDAFDPFLPATSWGLNQMMNLMDQFMDNPFFRAGGGGGGGGLGRGWAVKENDKELRLRFDMPGLNKEDVNISVEHNALVIRGEADHDNDGKGRRYSSRINLIPTLYNLNEIKAEMSNGVLKVVIPKLGDEHKEDVINVQVT